MKAQAMARDNYTKGLFAKFSQRDMRSQAYKNLSALAKVAIFELELHYWESGRSNPIEITQRWLAELICCNPKTAGKVITSLEGYKFLEVERIGKMKGPLRARAAIYRLTWHPDNEGQPPTHDYRQWTPPIPPSTRGK